MTWVCRTQFNYATQAVAATPTDPVFSSVSLLLHGNGVDGGTSFVDSSSAGRSITRIGSTTTSTAAVKYGSASLLHVAASTCGLSIASTVDGALQCFATTAGRDFRSTVECWFKTSTTTANQTILCNMSGPFLDSSWSILMSNSYAGSVEFWLQHYSVGAAMFKTSVTNYADGNWHHVAVTKDASQLCRMFVDGNLIGSATAPSLSVQNAAPITVGYDANYGRYFNGNIDDVRITQSNAASGGTSAACRYTAAFTPPTAQFPDA